MPLGVLSLAACVRHHDVQVLDASSKGLSLEQTIEASENALIHINETGVEVTYGDVVNHLVEEFNQPDYKNADVLQIHESVYCFIANQLGISREVIPNFSAHAMNWFDKKLLRIVDRSRMINAALGVSQSMRIYGPNEWAQWPEYSPYYQSYLDDQDEIREVFQTTRLNLHNNCNGFGMHFRVLDCMASEGCMLVNAGKFEDLTRR
jgi:hypothetical protein